MPASASKSYHQIIQGREPVYISVGATNKSVRFRIFGPNRFCLVDQTGQGKNYVKSSQSSNDAWLQIKTFR